MEAKQHLRRLPTNIPSFKEMREDGYLYVDKSDLVWQIANGEKFNYLSRPRRFGKSILIDTLACYFEGRKELFEGLKIMELEEEWTPRPVVRLDMSNAGKTVKEIESYFDYAFREQEELYRITPPPQASLTVRFLHILKQACKQRGQRVAVLIDEYDAPLQHSWGTPDHTGCTEIYRSVFAVLKSGNEYEKFVFIAGITKFTQISLFSVLNNLSNLSFLPQYAAVCGITESDITQYFQPEIEQMALARGCTAEEVRLELKGYYDGYHFSVENMVDVYNPYSLVNALKNKKTGNFWVSSGATSLLPKFVTNMELRMSEFDDCSILALTIESSDVTGGGAELFLYQSGYLTIKGYKDGEYFLGFPNDEVRQALYSVVLPALTLRKEEEIQSVQNKLYHRMTRALLPEAMDLIKQLIADVPYSNKKLQSMDMEERYRLIISYIMHAVGLHVQVERMMHTGRIDMVIWTTQYIYVVELKLTKNGGLQAAEAQIRERQYTAPFATENRKVIALAIELDDSGKGMLRWKEVTTATANPRTHLS